MTCCLQRSGAARSREGGAYGRGNARGRESQAGSEADFGAMVAHHAHAAGQATDGSALRLRGLPYSATVQDIVEFFAGKPLSSGSVGHVNLLNHHTSFVCDGQCACHGIVAESHLVKHP